MITIGHLYPESMNLYGDRGNVIALMRRAQWRHLPAQVVAVEPGQSVDWARFDLLFMGGGEDRHQAEVAEDLLRHQDPLLQALEAGLPMLAICGAFQLLGRFYETAEGIKLPGLGFLPAYTRSGNKRCIGNVVVDATALGAGIRTLVGFENHGGRTFLEEGGVPLGRVLKGYGNNGEDQTEGAVRRHVIGTYLHGSLLPKNPRLADEILRWALAYKGEDRVLEDLVDAMEDNAHQRVVERELALSSSSGH